MARPEREDAIAGANAYLETGGLGEVLGFASMAFDMGQPKVQMDTDMAIALCLLASEALMLRGRAENGKPN